MTDVVLTTEARDNLSELPTNVREAVLATLTDIQLDPTGAGKPLVGRLAGLWSARVGVYRVLYRVDGTRVVVRAIRHRAIAYGRRAPRRRR